MSLKESSDSALLPRDPATGEPLPPRRQPGYYAGFSTLSQSPFWDDATRSVVETRVTHPPQRKFLTEEAWDFWTAVFEHLVPQSDRTADRQICLVAPLDDRLAHNRTAGYRYEDMPHDREAYQLGMEAINQEAEHRFGGKFALLPYRQRELVLKAISEGTPQAARDIWKQMAVNRFWQLIVGDAAEAYYAHPWAWDEIGFGGPAYPRAYTRLERGEPEPWEVAEQRYEWLAPEGAASAEIHPEGDDDTSHHGSGGTH
jgi:hypothetical protein